MADEDLLACEPWATPDDVFGLGSKYDDADSYLLADALIVATDVLYLATGRQYPGHCGDVVRPCGRFGRAPVAAYHGSPVDAPAGWLYDYGWGSCGCSGRPRTGCCSGRSRVRLGHYPVVSIEEVVVDGDVLDEGVDYWLEDHRWLVRLPDDDGKPRSWPCCQRLDLPATEEDTFAVSLVYGARPPRAGVLAAAQFAGEIVLDLAGSDDCALGERVRSYTRQQTTVQISQPPEDVLEDLPRLARLFVRSVNPHNVKRPPTVWSPDLGPPVTRPNTPPP